MPVPSATTSLSGADGYSRSRTLRPQVRTHSPRNTSLRPSSCDIFDSYRRGSEPTASAQAAASSPDPQQSSVDVGSAPRAYCRQCTHRSSSRFRVDHGLRSLCDRLMSSHCKMTYSPSGPLFRFSPLVTTRTVACPDRNQNHSRGGACCFDISPTSCRTRRVPRPVSVSPPAIELYAIRHNDVAAYRPSQPDCPESAKTRHRMRSECWRPSKHISGRASAILRPEARTVPTAVPERPRGTDP